MSSLLEEAIVDAKALKEAALKNAEDAVLEKYSGEVRKALDTLLEQDEMGLEEDAPDGEDLMEFTEEVPFAFANEEIGAPKAEEIVEIDFDALKARLEEEEEVVEEDALNDALGMADEIALEEATGPGVEDFDTPAEATLEDEPAEQASVKAGTEESATPERRAAPSSLSEDEEIDLTEEMLADLIEELVVDMTPVPQGWSSMNSADNFVQQANNDAMAAAEGAHLEEDEDIEEDASTSSDVVDAASLRAFASTIASSNNEDIKLLQI